MVGLSLSALLGSLPPDNKFYFGPGFLDLLKEALVKPSSLLDRLASCSVHTAQVSSFTQQTTPCPASFWVILQFCKAEAVALILRKHYHLHPEKEAVWTLRLRSIPDCSELEWQEASLDLPRPGTEEGAAANRTAGNVGGGQQGLGRSPTPS